MAADFPLIPLVMLGICDVDAILKFLMFLVGNQNNYTLLPFH
jgi:hypothetical protein